ncbi:Retrovirus-related Pol polyprotein from transposon gypsy [Sesamum angolense]|uniref:RNA-directed DNA polymerase n=1 Tax=Sesamum angolense TaxID=2727404 RepID=A0AAE1T498_9LAMI|nr:Retrovirus-related Pol polyprotein from transposon gypsy [Sesamum angolense]
MYVRVQINGKAVIAMLDSGATHNFVADREIQKLGLTLAQHSSHIKAVNSEAEPIQGVACVELKGTYLQDSVQSVEKKDSLMSAIKVKAGLRHGEQTYLAALIEIKLDVIQEVPNKVAELLQEFKDVSLLNCLRSCPTTRAIDHAIELEPGSLPPAQAPYRMAPAELAESRKQLDGLLEARLVQRSKVSYGSPVLFQRKQGGSMRMCVDYRALNKVTIKNKYPIPNAIDLFDKLTKAKYYTKIDLRSGYWQVRVARDDEPKTTCATSQGKIQMDRKKVQAVMDWGIPSKMVGLRLFLGLANYYRRFIKGYSKIVNLLKDLLRKDQKWEWTVACNNAFRSLKQAISSQLVLKLPQFDKPFEVQVDASNWAVGGMLVQDKHPVAFESRKLKDAELQYRTHEKKMTVVIHCLEAWRYYLLGTKFIIVTDNVANTYFKTQWKLSPKQARWQEFLGEFDFEWVYRSGKHNDMTDAVSRKLVEEYVAALTVVESDFLDQNRESSKTDAGYLKLVE